MILSEEMPGNIILNRIFFCFSGTSDHIDAMGMGSVGDIGSHRGLPSGLPGGLSGGLSGGLPGMPGGLGGIDLSGGIPHQTFTLSGMHAFGDSSDSLGASGASSEPICEVSGLLLKRRLRLMLFLCHTVREKLFCVSKLKLTSTAISRKTLLGVFSQQICVHQTISQAASCGGHALSFFVCCRSFTVSIFSFSKTDIHADITTF